MSDPLISPTFLFRFSVPCLHHERLWTDRGVELDEAHRLPSFGELEGRPMFADVRGAWSEAGLSFTVRVVGKKQVPWCRPARAEDSDGLSLWIDTRDTHNIHRAGRFCHRLVFLPAGAGAALAEPVAQMLPIRRARENPKPIGPGVLAVRSRRRIDGYVLEAHIPCDALTGFDRGEHGRIGFMYAVLDRELGMQTFSVGPEFPLEEDPSVWGTLELVTRVG